MATVTYDDIKGKLLPLSEVYDRLGSLEPVGTTFVDAGAKMEFEFGPNWDIEVGHKGPTDAIDASLTVDGEKFSLTSEGLLSATSNAGIPKALVKKMPGSLLKTNLDYFYGKGMDDAEYNALIVDKKVASFTRPSIEPYSNIGLLDAAVKGIQNRYGKETEVVADYKLTNSLTRSDLRLIIPSETWAINGGGMPDVPSGQVDQWNVGIHLSNSLIGKTSTTVESYLFRWWCTNGAITVPLTESTKWRRKGDGDAAEVMDWAEFQVNEVLETMQMEFERIQHMVSLVVDDPELTLRGLFNSSHLPAAQRQAIIQFLADFDGDLTMYTVMQAVTRIANDVAMSADNVDRLLRLGGATPTLASDPTLAKVWSQGHAAPKDASNPFAVTV